MLKKMMLIITLALLFNGCSEKVIYIKNKPFEFKKIKPPAPVTIRVYKDDEDTYKEYIKLLRGVIKLYDKQIDRYNLSFKYTKVEQ